ncbi:MAG: exodeoxyribonuclease VII small subunit [Rikenellaceae bacterium]|jgi:exodeoxyribonuclease VII small subunit|nr:exodeoxyribonuclease VII small subunit [Rikenellaceae bacterium]
MAPKKEFSYNEAIREVEAILEKLNREEPDVDQLGELVKRAVELIALCKEKLRTAEEEVAKVIRKEEDN